MSEPCTYHFMRLPRCCAPYNDIYHLTLKKSISLKCLEEIIFLKLFSERVNLFGLYLKDLAHIRGDLT